MSRFDGRFHFPWKGWNSGRPSPVSEDDYNLLRARWFGALTVVAGARPNGPSHRKMLIQWLPARNSHQGL